MSIVCNTYVNGNMISWEGNKGVVEVSTLMGMVNRDASRIFSRFYDDACDEGFIVVGKNEEVPFVIEKTDYSRELNGEIDGVEGWRLVSVKKNGRPDGRFEILVIND